MQPRRAPLTLIAAALAALALAAQAPAGPIVVAFEGHLTETLSPASIIARGYDPSIAVGAPFSGSFSYDPETALDEYPDVANLGRYAVDGEMAGQVGNVSFQALDLVVLIYDDWSVGVPTPYDSMIAGGGGTLGGRALIASTFILTGDNGAFANDNLPRILDLSSFTDVRSIDFYVPDSLEGSIGLAHGVVTQLTAIPEPTSGLILLMLALCAMGFCTQGRPLLRDCHASKCRRSSAKCSNHSPDNGGAPLCAVGCSW